MVMSILVALVPKIGNYYQDHGNILKDTDY